jgi:hypothetical protein
MVKRKVKVGSLIDELVNDAKEIECSKEPQKVKTQRFKRLAARFINQVYGDGRRSESIRIAPSTARRYLTRARKAIREFTGIHHRFSSEIDRLSKKYPMHSGVLNDMKGLAPDDARKAKKKLLDSLIDARDIIDSVDNLDFSKSFFYNQVVKLSKKHPNYSLSILLLNAGDIQLAKQTIYNVIKEVQPLYNDVSELKVDHELMVNLAMDRADKDLMAKKAKQTLSVKKNTKVHIDYPRYMNQVLEILKRSPDSFEGDLKDAAPLIFALCAVTGRRPVEVLLTGGFTAKAKNTLLFTGQAKKRDGDDDTERLIYSLVDSNLVVNSFCALRSLSNIKKLITGDAKGSDYRDENSQLSGKISPHLSVFAKSFFIDKKRVFKDTRGIYGAICYQSWYLTDPRWKNKDTNIFFSELFGHSDVNSQSHYMPYQLTNFNADYEPDTSLVNHRWEKLCRLDEYMPNLARLDAAVEIHEAVKEMVLNDHSVCLTQTMLSTKTKKFRGTIKNYLMTIGDLALPDEPLSVQFNDSAGGSTDHGDNHSNDNNDNNDNDVRDKKEETPLINKEKPHINAHSLGNGLWKVTVKMGAKNESFTVRADDNLSAMRTGYIKFIEQHPKQTTVN